MFVEIALVQRFSLFLGHPVLFAEHRVVRDRPVDRRRKPLIRAG